MDQDTNYVIKSVYNNRTYSCIDGTKLRSASENNPSKIENEIVFNKNPL